MRQRRIFKRIHEYLRTQMSAVTSVERTIGSEGNNWNFRISALK